MKPANPRILTINGGSPIRREMKRGRHLAGAGGGSLYSVTVPAIRPAADFTVRVTPNHDGVAVPLEAAQILWQPRPIGS